MGLLKQVGNGYACRKLLNEYLYSRPKLSMNNGIQKESNRLKGFSTG